VSNDDQLKAAADRAFDVLQRAASALCRALPPQQRPAGQADELHIWALSHGVADLFVEARPASPSFRSRLSRFSNRRCWFICAAWASAA